MCTPKSRDGTEQGEPQAVGLAQDDRRADDGDGDAVGEVFGGPFSRPLAMAVVRYGFRQIGFGFRHALVGRTGRGKRGYGDQYRRGRLPGAHLGDVRHAALIHAIEVSGGEGLRASGDMIDDLLPFDRGDDAGAVGHVAIDEARPRLPQRFDPRTLPHEASDFVAAVRQRRNQVRSDESTGAGNQYFGHGTGNRKSGISRNSLATACHCFAEAVRSANPCRGTASAKQWHTFRGEFPFFPLRLHPRHSYVRCSA